MENQTIKIYENTTGKVINVVGVGEIGPHERISIRAGFHAPVNLANYPGVIDVLANEAAGNPVRAINPSDHSEYTKEEQEANQAEVEVQAKITAERAEAIASAEAATAPQTPAKPAASATPTSETGGKQNV